MRTFYQSALALAVGLAAVIANGQDAANAPATPAEKEFETLRSDWEKTQEAFMAKFQATKTDAEKRQLIASAPKPDATIEKMIALAEKNPDAPVATSALVWATLAGMGRNEKSEAAYDTLIASHLDKEEIAPLTQYMAYRGDEKSLAALEKLAADSAHVKVKGMARFTLASMANRQLSRMRGDQADTLRTEVIAELEAIKKDYGDVTILDSENTLGDAADGLLFSLTKLAIGAEAPEIEGENGAGVPMKLSDYRGRVVLLDFWGDW